MSDTIEASVSKTKKPKAPWEVTGSKITGYWAFWPFHGEEFARRFEKEEDALRWLPVKKGNKGRKLPMGNKVVIRVGFDTEHYAWTYDPVADFSQGEVDELFMEMAAEVTA